MIFYTKQHKYFCGIDLHTKTMYICIIDREGKVLVHRNVAASPDVLLKVIEPYREDICIGVECTFSWYWVADLCEREDIPFVLGHALYLLDSVPGIGKILSLVLLYEIHDIHRFSRVQDFVSYCRLVKPDRESGGKKSGARNSKIGNVHLKWAFSEAAVLFLRGNERAQKLHDRLVSKHGKAKALSILAHKLGRAVYFMLKRRGPFDMETFFARG